MANRNVKTKTLCFVLLGLIALLVSGCHTRDAVREDTPETETQEAPTAQMSEGAPAGEMETLWYDSVQALAEAIRAERNAAKKHQIAVDNRLEDLSVLYAPAAPYEGFALFKVEVNPYSVFYYYLPEDDELGQIDPKKDIIVTVYRSDEFTMDSICAQHGIKPDADGFAYAPKNGKIFFQMDDTVIGICAPEDMNDYDTLRSLCQVKRMELTDPTTDGSSG